MNIKTTVALVAACCILASCSDEPGNDQIGAVPEMAKTQKPAPTTPTPDLASVPIQNVPPVAQDDKVLNDVIDTTGK